MKESALFFLNSLKCSLRVSKTETNPDFDEQGWNEVLELAEEQGVLPREGDVAVDALYLVVVPGVVTSRCDGLNAIPLVQEVVHSTHHLRPWRVLVCLCLHPQQFAFQLSFPPQSWVREAAASAVRTCSLPVLTSLATGSRP